MKLDIKADKTNFFTRSTAVFTKVDKSEVKGKTPDYISYCKLYSFDELDLSKNTNLHFIGKTSDGTFVYENKSLISSKYWYTTKGVYRESDHWGNVASCHWLLFNNTKKKGNKFKPTKGVSVGFAKWDDFVFFTKHVQNILLLTLLTKHLTLML